MSMCVCLVGMTVCYFCFCVEGCDGDVVCICCDFYWGVVVWSEVYVLKRMGPRTTPCGTPVLNWRCVDGPGTNYLGYN